MIYLLQRLHDRLPGPIRRMLGGGARTLLPAVTRYGTAFRDERNLIAATREDEELAASVSSRRMSRLIESAGRTSRMRALLAGAGIDLPADLAWDRIPFLTKDDLRRGFDWVGDPASPEADRVHKVTGGSTGAPFPFVIDRAAGQRDFAYVSDMWQGVGVGLDARRVMVRGFYDQGRPVAFDPVRNVLTVSTFFLTAAHSGSIADAILRFQPEILHGFPSALDLLTRLQGDRLAAGLERLACVSASSETMMSWQRTRLEQTFRVPVVELYGLSERAAFASQCRYAEGFHVAGTYGRIELIDKNGLPIEEPGVPGEIVASSFINLATPLLRYRTGDLARWAVGCRCGRPGPVLSGIEGRLGETNLICANGDEISSLTLQFPEVSFLERIRFIQTVPGEARLLLQLRPDAPRGTAEMVVGAYRRVLGTRVRLIPEVVEMIELTPAGKHRILDQRIPR